MDTATSPSARPMPSAAPMLSPVPADDAAPQDVRPDDLGRPGDPGQRRPAPERPLGVVGQPAARRRGRSSRCPTRRRGRSPARRRVARRRRGRRRPAARSASRAAAAPARTRAAFSGSCSASQRSLVTVNDIVGTDPVRAAHSARPAELARPGRGGLRRRLHVVPQHRGPDDRRRRRRGAPCRAAGRRPRPLRARSSSSAPGAPSAPPTSASGSHSVPSGAARRPRPTTVPSSARTRSTLVDCVEESIPATSFTTVTVTKLRRDRH